MMSKISNAFKKIFPPVRDLLFSIILGLAISAAIYIETQIKPKAARTPKKPPPATLDPIRGSGYKEGQLGGKGLLIE